MKRTVPVSASGKELLELATLTPATALSKLGTSLDGLSASDANRRLRRHGPNTVAHVEHKNPARRILELLLTPLSLLLMGLAAVSYVTGSANSAAVIAVMVVLSTLLSFVQEFRSGQAAARLQAMVHTTATVLRKESAKPREVPLAKVVPGDIVHLSAGDMVPADARSVGEGRVRQPVRAHRRIAAGREARTRAVWTAGRGEVRWRGRRSVSWARISSAARQRRWCSSPGSRRSSDRWRRASLQSARADQLRPEASTRVTWVLIRFMLVMVPVVFLLNGFVKGDWKEAFLFAIAVAVGLTPEMLPMVVTANLARGAVAMSRHKVIVKRLNAIQNLGAMDVLCTDKTGTLTQDKVILEKHHESDEAGPICASSSMAYLNSYYQTGLKNLLDRAVLEHIERARTSTSTASTRKSMRSRSTSASADVGRRGERRRARMS